ncbi:MAG: peptidylprolyl isomerase, partial [Sedimentisphaerales bacterium]|nr:peptidylprolyl isomerase [Sedimentisphaerales bacterium]
VDSANSQFFINLVDNSHLDPTSGNNGYAVFGRVIRGLEVVDAIALTPTHEADDAFKNLPDDPVIIEKMVLIHTFGESSDAFEQTPFLGAADGIERIYQGQGRYDGRQFSQQFEQETFLGIDALRWRQTAADATETAEAAGIESFSLLLARDTQENLWILQYICREGTGQEERRVDPNNPLDIVPFEQFTEENMLFRLINGDYDPENLADPNHLLVLTGPEGTIIHQIVSFSGSLPGLNVYGDELVIVRQAQPGAASTGWSYYHDSVGLVLALQETSDDPADPNYFDPNDPGLSYRDRTGWRLSWYGQSAPTFYPDSSDLGGVAFVHLAPGDIRVHRGQGSFAGSPYRLTAARENFLGIHCLVLSETAVASWARPDRTLWLARDTADVVWVAKEISGQTTYFEAADIDQFIPASMYPDMFLRLASGRYQTGDQIISGDPPDQETAEIVSQTESLERWPQYNRQLVLVKTTMNPDGPAASWSYYHESVGSVLEIWPADPQAVTEPNQIDPNDNGWILTEPSDLEDVLLKFQADENRQAPADCLEATGRFAAQTADFNDGQIYVRVGPWQAAIDTAQLQRLTGRHKTYWLYEGSPDGISRLVLLFDPARGRFSLAARGVDCTGLAEPVPVAIAVGDYFGSGHGGMKAGQKPPMRFLQDYTDALRMGRFRFVFDNGPNASSSYGLTIHGDISTRLSPIDLAQKDVTIKFYSTYALDAGDLVKVRNKNKYVYRNPSGNPRQVEFDLDRCTFKVVIKKTYLGGQLPRDFRIQFEPAEDESFDEQLTVEVPD